MHFYILSKTKNDKNSHYVYFLVIKKETYICNPLFIYFKIPKQINAYFTLLVIDLFMWKFLVHQIKK